MKMKTRRRMDRYERVYTTDTYVDGNTVRRVKRFRMFRNGGENILTESRKREDGITNVWREEIRKKHCA